MLPSKRKRGRERRRRQRQGDEESSNSSSHSDADASDLSSVEGDANPMAIFHQWSFDEEAGHVKIVHHILSFLSVVELVEKKQVCKKWQQLCTQTTDNKCKSPKNFKTNQELRDAVRGYCSNEQEKIEVIAVVYGYPINKWKVQELDDFSMIFFCMTRFNEYIGDWDVSKAKKMSHMFYYASSFNQPLPWNTANVTNMAWMFYYATSFNQSLESWDTSKLTSMSWMFHSASSYNQPMDTWDTGKIVDMKYAFLRAESFNQSLKSWVFHDEVDTGGMLFRTASYNQELPDALDPDVVFEEYA